MRNDGAWWNLIFDVAAAPFVHTLLPFVAVGALLLAVFIIGRIFRREQHSPE